MRFIKEHINIFLLLAIVIAANWAGSLIYKRFDLTQEKKYSLSNSTKTFLANLDDVASIRVFLTGKLPAGMSELEQATNDLLNEFKAYAGSNIQYEFIDLTKLDRDVQEKMGQDLMNLGLQPTSLTIIENGEQTQKVIFPGAIVSYKNSTFPVTLLENQVGLDQYQILNNSITLLEYNFANAIQKLQQNRPPTIAISQGHGETSTNRMKEFIEAMQRENFAVAAIDLKESYRVEPIVDVLIIPKPTKPFAEKEKYKIDQFVMRGGKVLWLIDQMAVDMDSLNGTSYFEAQARDLNLNDILFKYGVRINDDLVQDLQSSKISIQTGMVNGAPQEQMFDWLFHPLITPLQNHPVSKNLAPISGRFVSTIDTIRTEGTKKTVLLSTSNYSKALMAPVRVHLGIVGETPPLEAFKQSSLPVAVALEGTFESIFKNRLTKSFLEMQDTVDNIEYKEVSSLTKMIVVSDGDIISNEIKNKQQFPLGYATYGVNNDKLVFDNKVFLKNAIEYLIDDNKLIETRNKEFKLRQLDAIKVKNQKSTWQALNLVLPVVITVLLGFVFTFLRKRKYSKK